MTASFEQPPTPSATVTAQREKKCLISTVLSKMPYVSWKVVSVGARHGFLTSCNVIPVMKPQVPWVRCTR